MANKVNIGQNSKVNVKWRLLPIDYSEEAEKSIISKFAKKYGIPKDNISVEPQYITKSEDGSESVLTSGLVSDIQDPIYQQSLFRPYLEERGITDYDFDKIIEIDNLINSKINYDVYDKHKRYTTKWIKWSNFMSFGQDNFFDFTKLSGLVLLTSEPANQGGKTTFCLDLFRFLLYGKVTSREDEWVLARAFNDFIPEATEMSVEGCISIDGQDYIIKRVLTRPALKNRSEKSKVTQKVYYYRLVGDKYVGLEDYESNAENEAEQNGRETNKTIKEAIGNEKDFDLMICVDSDNLKGLISLKDTDRGRLINRWIGLLPLEEKEKVAKDIYNHNIVPTLLMNRFSKGELVDEATELTNENTRLEERNKVLSRKSKETEKNIKKFESEREKLLQSKKPIDDALTKIDLQTLSTRIEQIKEKGTQKREEKKRNEEALQAFSDVEYDENEYQELIIEDKNTAIEFTNIGNEYRTLKADIEALKKGEFCPTCGARLKDVDNSEAIAKKEERLAFVMSEGARLRTKTNELAEKKAKIEEKRSNYQKKTKLELLIATNDVDINKLLAEYRECIQLMKDIEDNKTAIKENNDIDTRLNVNLQNMSVERNLSLEIDREKTSNSLTIENNVKRIKTIEETIKTLEKEEILVRSWKIYLDIIGKNGISKMVLRSCLPLINGELKRILNGVCDFDVEVKIDNDNSVAFYHLHDGVRKKLGGCSGFEQTVASLALRSVLSKISTFSKPSFVVFDEILGGVADYNYDNVKLLYDKIVKDYQCILQITHLKQIADWHTNTITIVKENNISKIKQM